MKANYVQRLRIRFAKNGPARYIGHLDLVKALERSLNRSQIPVARTQGFNRRPRLALAAPLALGCTSSGELFDIWLTERREPGQVQTALGDRAAPGITIMDVAEVPVSDPALQTITVESHYEVITGRDIGREQLSERVVDLLNRDAIMREKGRGRKRKTYDLKERIVELAVGDSDRGQGVRKVALFMRLAQLPAYAGRPEEVLEEMSLEPQAAHIHRIRILLEGQ